MTFELRMLFEGLSYGLVICFSRHNLLISLILIISDFLFHCITNSVFKMSVLLAINCIVFENNALPA
jgi:hypothetical protein